MVFVIIGAFTAIVYGLIFIWDDYMFDSLFNRIAFTPIAIPVSGLIGALLGYFVAATIGFVLSLANAPQEKYLINETNIYSVVDNVGIDGGFILGSGRVNDELKFYYIVKEELGERVDYVDAKKSHIVYTEGQPVLKTFHKDYRDKIWFWFSINFEQGYSYILEVPENTVKYDYTIDLQ